MSTSRQPDSAPPADALPASALPAVAPPAAALPADAAPNLVMQAARSSWAADPPTPPSGAQPTPSARRTASGLPRPLPPRPDARPRIVQDPVILGLTRVSRSRLGSRLFTWFFVFVYLVILIQLVWSILQG
jgi:hypothetical protein